MKAKVKTEFYLYCTVTVMAVLTCRMLVEANIFINDNENRAEGTFLKIESQAITTNKITSKMIHDAIDCAFECFQTPLCLSYNLGKTEREGTLICEPLKTTHLLTPLTAMPNYTHFYKNTVGLDVYIFL